MNNTLLCGVGGQGTVLASRIIALSGMEAGFNVRTAETIGMSQRGGCVVSHVRVSDKQINSSLIPKGKADVIIAFEPAEAVRWDGTVVVNTKAVRPVTASLSGSSYDGSEMLEYLKANVKNLTVIDGEEICARCGSPKVLNIALLAGAAKTGALGIDIQSLKNAIKKRVPEKFHEMNLKAVDAVVNG